MKKIKMVSIIILVMAFGCTLFGGVSGAEAKKIIIKLGITLFAMIFLSVVIPTEINAQDPANVDSKHFKVELENDHVRVFGINYDPV